MIALGVAFALGEEAAGGVLLVGPRLLTRHDPHRSPMTARPTPPTTRWTAPDTVPSRAHLHPRLPADLEALVAARHLAEVDPGRFRRGPRPRPAAPAPRTPRQQYDQHVNRLAAAVLDHDEPAARRHHTAGRATSTSTTPATEATTTRDTHPPSTPTTDSTSTPTHTTTDTSTATPTTSTSTSTTGASGQQPLSRTPHRQDTPATRPPGRPCAPAGVRPAATGLRPLAERTDHAATTAGTHSGGLPHASQPQDDRR